MEEGKFRNDLYFRLTAFPIEVPPLRERKDDIPALAEHFLYQIEGGNAHLPLSQVVIESLLMHDYPGNVRELRNIMERACILASSGVITAEHLVFEQFTYIDRQSMIVRAAPDAQPPGDDHDALLVKQGRDRHSSEQILGALRACNGNRSRAAGMLGVSERTMYRYVKRLREESRRDDH